MNETSTPENPSAMPAQPTDVPGMLHHAGLMLREIRTQAAAYGELMRALYSLRHHAMGEDRCRPPAMVWTAHLDGQATEIVTDLSKLSGDVQELLLMDLTRSHAQGMLLAAENLRDIAGCIATAMAEALKPPQPVETPRAQS